MNLPVIMLGDVTEIEMGQAPAGDTYNVVGEGFPLVAGASDFGELHPATTRHTTAPTKVSRKGDIIICIRATIGDLNLADASYCLGRGVAGLRPKQGRVDERYLWRALEAFADDLRAKGRGATFLQVSKKDIASLEIPLPPLEEQKRIAAILDQADALRRLRRRALDRLNTLGQAIFHEMFGDPLEDPRPSHTWTREPLDKSIQYIDYRGKTPPKAPVGVRLITAKNVKMGSINLHPEEFIAFDAFDGWMTRGFPKPGDVLFTTEAPLGNVAILDVGSDVAVGQRLLTMRPDKNKILAPYLLYFLMSRGFRKKMFENSTGSTVVGIKSALLKKIPIAFPALHEQQEFAAAIGGAEAIICKAGGASRHSEALFTSLQHRAFRGEL